MAETFKCRVKPLVWEFLPDGQRCAKLHDGTEAIVWPEGGEFVASVGCSEKYFTSEASAKAACQRDHEARVKALLEIEEEK